MFLYYAESNIGIMDGELVLPHCHNEYEILYLMDGEAEYFIEGRKFYIISDSILLIPANSIHKWIYSSERINKRLSIHFLPEILNKTERLFFLKDFTEPVHILNGSLHKFNFFIQTLGECELLDESLQKVAAKTRLVSLLVQIHFLKTTKAIEPVVLDIRIKKIIDYIGSHLQDDLSLDFLADKFAFNKNHLNVLFNKIVGTTIMKYVTAKRLGFTQQEILAGARLGEASYSAGFKDYSTFFRAYKSFYGSSPSKILIGKTDIPQQ